MPRPRNTGLTLSIGAVIRKSREERGWTLRQVGAMCDCTHVSISQIETGKHAPGIETLCKLADAFGLTTDFILGREEGY